MASYVILPRLQIENANAQPAWWLASAPALTAYAGFAHALGLSFADDDNEAQRPSGFAVIHHHIQFLGDVFYGKLYPQQMQAAMLINEEDHIGKASVSKSKSKQSIQRGALADQPSIRCHLIVSLVIRFAESGFDSNQVSSFLRRARLAGGTISNFEKYQGKKLVYDFDDVLKNVPRGYVIHERQDLMVKQSEEEDWLDVLLRVTKFQTREKGQGWIMPTTLGYLTISEIKARKYSRNGLPHAYVEPLVGLIQYQTFDKQNLPFWQWIYPNSRSFILSTQPIN
jgi:CRISPR-associated protein Csy2